MPPVPKPKRNRQPTFLREWRKHRGLTLAKASERFDIDPSTLSRIERGAVPYDQDFLEQAADAYRCEVADLLVRNPLLPDAVWSLADNLKRATPEQRQTIETLIDALLKKAS